MSRVLNPLKSGKKIFGLFVFGFIFPVVLLSSRSFAQDSFEDEIKNYDRDDIHSIHKKLYTKEGRHEVTLTAGGIFNNNGYGLAGLQYQYHLLENLAIEAVNTGFGYTAKGDDRLYFYQAGLNFSPLYGKVSLFTWAVANFDVYTVGGAGVVRYTGRFHGTSFMGNVGLGERYFINEFLSFRVEFRDYIYNQDRVGSPSKIQHNYTLTGGLSVMFPLRQNY